MTNEERLLSILVKNPSVQSILQRAGELGMPHWYLGAGGIAQTVWNTLLGNDPTYGIRDYDLIYYDKDDLSYGKEDSFIQRGRRLFRDIPVEVEIRNQARVHLWYEKHFGFPINQYQSAEEAIASWPSTANSIGVTNDHRRFRVCAPYGFDELFELIVRPNKTLVTREMYENKVRRWIRVWPKLKIIPWDDTG